MRELPAADGSAIYYVSGDQLYRVAFVEGPTPQLGRPEVVGQVPEATPGRLQIHPDGRSYLVAVPANDGENRSQRARVKIVQDWTAKLTGDR